MAMQYILTKTHGATNTEHWLGHKEDNTYPNTPLLETCLPVPDSIDDFVFNGVAPMVDTDEEIITNPQEWNDVVGDPLADDDLPF